MTTFYGCYSMQVYTDTSLLRFEDQNLQNYFLMFFKLHWYFQKVVNQYKNCINIYYREKTEAQILRFFKSSRVIFPQFLVQC